MYLLLEYGPMKSIFQFSVLLVALCIHTETGYAQKEGKAYVDSLLQELPKAKEDTNKVLILNDLSFNYYYYSIDSSGGLTYGNKGLALAEKLGWEYGIGDANNVLGANYLAKSLPDKALKCFQQALATFEHINNKTRAARVLGNIGNLYADQGNFAKALDDDFKALKIFEDLKDKSGVTKNLGNIADVYLTMGDYPRALEYSFKSLKINEDIGIKADIAANLTNIGGIYLAINDYSKALEYEQKALKTSEEVGDKGLEISILQNIGTLYCKQKDYARSLQEYTMALDISKEVKSISNIALNLVNIGYINQLQGNYREALVCEFKALGMFRETGNKQNIAWNEENIGLTYLSIAKDIHEKATADGLIAKSRAANLSNSIDYLDKACTLSIEIGYTAEITKITSALSEAHALSGNYKDALKYYKQYITIKDSVFSIDNTKKIANLESKRETELKEKQIEVQRLQIVAAMNERKYYLAGLAAFVLLSVGMFGRFRAVRRNKKQLEDKNKIIAIEKENADRSRIRAERSEQFKQQFLANMSHEIRTPMNAVSGITDLLLQKSPRPDQLAYLQAISKSSDILLHVINDILDLSKIEAGKLELEKIEFSLPDTLKQVTDTLSYKAEEKGLQLIAHIDDNVPDVLIGDPYRLNQVLINLGGNAIKFTEKGGVQIDVKQVGDENGELALHFSVTDTGIGIPQDRLQKLFESFAQVNSSDTRKFGGTGLGLSISKQLVELQGGNISVESKEGSGTTFSFVINYPIGSAEKLQQRIAAEQAIDGSVLNGLRILVADDNEYNRLVVNETLHLKADVHIDLVTNGQEAIQMLEQNDYDVILMDVQMPVMNGIDATKYIRNKMEGPKSKIPIIALTASILRANLDMCTESGMNSYIPKPFKTWQLIHSIADVTGRRQTTPQVAKKQEMKNPSTTTITNLTYLREFCEDDEERIKKYTSLYINALPGFEAKIKSAMAAKDLDEVAALVHSFKPKWMMMGMKQTNEIGQKIEMLCTENGNEEMIKKYLLELLEQNNFSMKELTV